MIQEVHKVTSARYSKEWSKWHCLHYPRLASRCWQPTLLANCPAGKLTSETVGKLPCWQTALLANLLLRLLANCPADKLPLLANCPAGKNTLQKSPSAPDAVKSRTHLPLAKFPPAQSTPPQGVLAPQKIERGIWLNFKKYYSLCYYLRPNLFSLP